MNWGLNADYFKLKPKASQHWREEIYISPHDLQKLGIRQNDFYGILSVDPLYPGPPAEQHAVHVVVDNSFEPGNQVFVNQHLWEHIHLQEDDTRYWSFKPAAQVIPLSQVVLEIVVEQTRIGRELEELRRDRQNLFSKRCLLVEDPRDLKSVALPVLGRGYFNIRSVQPPLPSALPPDTLMVIEQDSEINLFAPHRKSGVDMVLVIDGSGSMDFRDYEMDAHRVATRLEGAHTAVDTLLRRRLAVGSRVARIACIVFANNVQAIYPLRQQGMVELNSISQFDEMLSSIRYLTEEGLRRLGIDRVQTDIKAGMRAAADLLDQFFEEGNEKVIVLLSDGADWKEESDESFYGEIVSTSKDAASLADSLHHHSEIRIHTIAISNERMFKKHVDQRYWNDQWAIPNLTLLRRIADVSEGLIFEGPDAVALTRLLDEIGEGITYPV